jgi:hypothetical protein
MGDLPAPRQPLHNARVLCHQPYSDHDAFLSTQPQQLSSIPFPGAEPRFMIRRLGQPFLRQSSPRHPQPSCLKIEIDGVGPRRLCRQRLKSIAVLWSYPPIPASAILKINEIVLFLNGS